MSLFGSHSVDQFLNEYWQSKPLIAPNAPEDLITEDLFFEAADTSEVDSYLVLMKKRKRWDVVLGPFAEEQIRGVTLPYNLNLRGLGRLLPELKDWSDRFHFLPDWQKEEVGLSYSGNGDPRGPYYNETDCFFFNLGDTLRFEFDDGRCEVEYAPHNPVGLVSNFESAESHEVSKGTLVYLPAGYVYRHTGTLVLAMACHAPKRSELMTDWLSFCETDPRLAANAEPGDGLEVTAMTIERVKSFLQGAMEEPDFLQWFARYTTAGPFELAEPLDEPMELEEFVEELGRFREMDRSESVRWAYVGGDQPLLLVHGRDYRAPLSVARYIASHAILELERLKGEEALLLELFNGGYLFFPQDE